MVVFFDIREPPPRLPCHLKVENDYQPCFWIEEEHKSEQEALNVDCVVRTWLLRSAVSASIVA